MDNKQEKFYYCQLQIEQDKWCKTQCKHCKEYYKPLEEEMKMEDLKEWIENKDLPGINPQTFRLVFEKEFQKGGYIGGCDPYEKESEPQSFAAVILSKPKKEYEIQKIKGFNRVINTGWNYITKILKNVDK